MAKTTTAAASAAAEPKPEPVMPAQGGSRTFEQREALALYLAGDKAQLDKLHLADRPAAA